MTDGVLLVCPRGHEFEAEGEGEDCPCGLPGYGTEGMAKIAAEDMSAAEWNTDPHNSPFYRWLKRTEESLADDSLTLRDVTELGDMAAKARSEAPGGGICRVEVEAWLLRELCREWIALRERLRETERQLREAQDVTIIPQSFADSTMEIFNVMDEEIRRLTDAMLLHGRHANGCEVYPCSCWLRRALAEGESDG